MGQKEGVGWVYRLGEWLFSLVGWIKPMNLPLPPSPTLMPDLAHAALTLASLGSMLHVVLTLEWLWAQHTVQVPDQSEQAPHVMHILGPVYWADPLNILGIRWQGRPRCALLGEGGS